MIPDIEEICRKLEILVFADTEVLANRDIPVLLKRTTEGVSAQVAETGLSVRAYYGSSAESRCIKIVVDSSVDVPVGLSGGDGETWIQRSRAGVWAAKVESKSTTWVNDREGSPRLKSSYPAERPTTQKCARASPKCS